MKLRLIQIKKELSRFANTWSHANIGSYGAAVAYYTVFSIAPLLIITVAIAALVVDASVVQAGIISEFEWMFGRETAGFIDSLISASRTESANIFMVILGAVFIIIGATGIFAAIQSGLDSVFESFPEKKIRGIWKIVTQRLISVGMVLLLGFTLLTSLIISTGISALKTRATYYLPGSEFFTFTLEFFVSLTLISLFLTMVLKYLPSKRLNWTPAAAGGMIGGLLFMLGKYGVGWYLGTSGAASAYGTASSIVLLILWAFYLSQTFFLSAIVAKLYFTKKGK